MNIHKNILQHHADNLALCAASEAYLRLLSLGMWRGRTTTRGQALLGKLRDAIHMTVGGSAQDIQDEYEAEAQKLQEAETDPK